MTSTRVATKGAEALAGSNFKPLRIKGNIDPESEPKVTIPTKAAPTVVETAIQCCP